MASFTAASFREKLNHLSDSQQSIQTLAHWVLYHRKSCEESAAVFAKETMLAKGDRRLTYMYVANEIIQTCQRKAPEFAKAYGEQLLEARPPPPPAHRLRADPHSFAPEQIMPKACREASEATRVKLLRLIPIWEERQSLPAPLIKQLRAKTGAGSPSPQPSDPSGFSPTRSPRGSMSPRGSGSSPRLRPATPPGVPLSQLLDLLEEGGLVEELQAEREADLGAITTDRDALAAAAMLRTQQSRLSSELADRRALVIRIASFCEKQHAQCDGLAKAHAEVTAALDALAAKHPAAAAADE